MSHNITENDYGFVENPESDFYGIKLKSGKWKNVIVIYGKVSIKESSETGYATLQFTYNIQDTSNFQHDELENDENFKNHLGDILRHIIESKEETNEE